MNNISLKIKLSIIFLLPSVVLLYLFSTYISSKYVQVHHSQVIKLSSKLTSDLSDLVHNLQIERGLSAGYIKKSDYKQTRVRLLEQYAKTDSHFQCLEYFENSDSPEKKIFLKLIDKKIKPIMLDVSDKLSHISEIREKVLDFNLSFEEKIKYYTNINFKIISAIKIINNLVYNQNNSSLSIEILEKLKEQAGLERAYLFNQLIESSKKNNLHLNKLTMLQKNQDKFEQEFFLGASKQESLCCLKYVSKDIKEKLVAYRKNFNANLLDANDAHSWFQVSTEYINGYDKTLKDILTTYTDLADKKFKEAELDLYMTLFFGIFAFLAILVIFVILIKLINKEEKYVENLRFEAYTFDSHEAMTITDMNATIIKANKAFTEITGYSKEEAIGKNPRILKSGVHEDSFYEDMWEKIQTVGKWRGEIYNKRKNGDIYPKLLSITAIKNDKDETTHYIAQFLDITELKDAQSRAVYQANHDFLTNVMNRKAITARLEEEFAKATRHGFLEAFFFIDLDNFKIINDTYGHKVGDEVLIEFTKRLHLSIRKEDLLARLSGDEFAIVLTNSNNDLDKLIVSVKAVADKIFKELSRDFIVQNHSIKLGASIGVSIFPLDQKNIDDVIHQGDLAMYEAKRNGKNSLKMYQD